MTGVDSARSDTGALPEVGRGLVEGLATSRPIAEQLPALFQEDDLCVRLTTALDEVLAPIYLVLDSIDAYVDPELAPEDFLEWLAGWVGLVGEDLGEGTDVRMLVAEATSLFALRGTPAGLARLLQLSTGRTFLLEDSGGVRWSATPASELPGSAHPFLTVRPEGTPISQAEERKLRQVLRKAVPAHVPATFEQDRPGLRQGPDSRGSTEWTGVDGLDRERPPGEPASSDGSRDDRPRDARPSDDDGRLEP